MPEGAPDGSSRRPCREDTHAGLQACSLPQQHGQNGWISVSVYGSSILTGCMAR